MTDNRHSEKGQKGTLRRSLGFAGKTVLVLLCAMFLASCSRPMWPEKQKALDLGKWNQTKIDHLLVSLKKAYDPGQKVAFISAAFLDTPYQANTLIGNHETNEVFTLRLDRVDCFTFIDIIEALRRSTNFSEFVKNLRYVRYQNGQINFQTRNHFFSQWGNTPFAPLRDITAQIGGTQTHWTVKYLNRKGANQVFLPGYPIKKQTVAFIPAEAIDQLILSRLHSGDYIGIYSPHPGLDVSHTGIVIKKGETPFLRHASSKRWHKKVRDEELRPYLAGKKGLIIYRPVVINAFQH